MASVKNYFSSVPVSISYKGEDIPVFLIYSPRRSWAIEVRHNGDVIIRLPDSASADDAKRIVEEKGDWILKQRSKFAVRVFPKRLYESGDVLPFFGEELVVQRCVGKAGARVEGGELVVSLPEGFCGDEASDLAREVVILLYRRLGLVVLDEFVEKYAGLVGVEKPAVRIKVQERRWGSCTPKNGITINARVLLAPRVVAEYLVVHEVVHLRFRHHQASFWEEVERVMPGYREAERLLKEEGWRYVF